MTKISISDFRANMSLILQKVQGGEVISLTERGSEIARIVPLENTRSAAIQLRDELRKTSVIGDLLSSIDAEWV